MRMRDVGMALVGGSVIYVSMAACSAGGGKSMATGGGEAGSGGRGAASGEQASGTVGSMMDPVPPASADPVSGSRLKAKFRTAEDGSKSYFPGTWYDSERNEDCGFNVAADGKERCLPAGSAGTIGIYFADPACTKPLAYGLASSCPQKYATSTEGQTCGLMVHVYQLGAAASLTKVYAKQGTNCADSGTPLPSFVYFEVGPEVPPSSFVAGSVGHD